MLEKGDIIGTFRLLEAFNPAPEGHLRIVIAGEAGEGKTWWLEHIVGNVSMQHHRSQSVDHPIPLYCQMKDLLEGWTKQQPVSNVVIDSCLAECGLAGNAGAAQWLAVAWKSQKLLLCLDGADEVPARLRDALVSMLRNLDQSGHFLLITSRRWLVSEVALRGTMVCDMDPLRYKYRRELIARLGFDAEVAHRLAEDGDLATVVVTPLHLALAWQVSRSGKSLRTHDLPQKMLQAYLARPWRRDRSDDRGVIEAKLRLLGRLASQFSHPTWTSEISSAAYFSAVDADYERELAQGADNRSLGEQLLDRLDALFETDNVDDQSVVRFVHRPFQEGLVAEWLGQLDPATRSEIIDSHRFDPSWIEVSRTVLIRADDEELRRFFTVRPVLSRCHIRAAAQASLGSPRILDHLIRVAPTAAALAYSMAANDRALASDLRDVLLMPSLEWEYFAADIESNPTPRRLAKMLGVDDLLHTVNRDRRARELLVRTLQAWDGELGEGIDHTDDEIRKALELTVHKTIMGRVAKSFDEMTQALFGHNDWIELELSEVSAEIERRLGAIRSPKTPPYRLSRLALATVDLLISRALDPGQVLDAISELEATLDPIEKQLLHSEPSWFGLKTLLASRQSNHLEVLTFLCGHIALSGYDPFEEMIDSMESVLADGNPNYPSLYERFEGIADRSFDAYARADWRSRYSEHESTDRWEEMWRQFGVQPVVRRSDIVKSLDYRHLPDPKELFRRLASAEEDLHGISAAIVPPDLSKFFARHLGDLRNEISAYSSSEAGLLLDLVCSTDSPSSASDVRESLEWIVLEMASIARKSEVGDWSLQLME
jgi:hypothetical protein